MTPLESIYPRTERLPWSRSIPRLNDSPGVVLCEDRMTPLESFYPRTERLPGVVLSKDRMSSLESFYPKTEGLPWSRTMRGQNDSPGVILSQD